jgi:hypothetical protein
VVVNRRLLRRCFWLKFVIFLMAIDLRVLSRAIEQLGMEVILRNPVILKRLDVLR